jgi:DNA mismatch repair protein MutS
MPFQSILFGNYDKDSRAARAPVPDCFHDLHLDQVVSAVTKDSEEYDLKPFFYAPLQTVEEVRYRHEVFRDLENQGLLVHLRSFAERMRTMRRQLDRVEKLHFDREKQSWFLAAVNTYCHAVDELVRDLTISGVQSAGLRSLLEYLQRYKDSSDFVDLLHETNELKKDLASIQYRLDIVGLRVYVDSYSEEPDYGAEVLATFDKFKQSTPRDYQFDLAPSSQMNHVEAGIIDQVTHLYPEVFASLDRYFVHRRFYLDRTIKTFDREIQFYIAYVAYMSLLKKRGLSFCYPQMSGESKELLGHKVFDAALAQKRLEEDAAIVPNEFYLNSPERIIVVSGPNQGGKTTFARTFGQLHYLGSLGCPVPGKEAKLFLFDKLFTHFEREEDLENLSGKLEDDLRRIHRILTQATSNSILIMNESFVSTTLSDALLLSKEIMAQIVERDMLCVSVTFLDELASFGPTTVSMMSTVKPDDTTQRTFRIVRREADGLAYAAALAAKYRLTYKDVKERVAA